MLRFLLKQCINLSKKALIITDIEKIDLNKNEYRISYA